MENKVKKKRFIEKKIVSLMLVMVMIVTLFPTDFTFAADRIAVTESQSGTTETGTTETGTTEAGMSEAGTTETGTTEAGTSETETLETGTTEAGTSETGTLETGTTEAGTSETSDMDTSESEMDTTQEVVTEEVTTEKIEEITVSVETLSYQIPEGQNLVIPYVITPANIGDVVTWTSDAPESIRVASIKKDAEVEGKYWLTLEVLKATATFISITANTEVGVMLEKVQVKVKGLAAIHAESIRMTPSQYVRTREDSKGNTVYCVEKGKDFFLQAEITPSDTNDIISWDFKATDGSAASKFLTYTVEETLVTITPKATGMAVITCNASGGAKAVCYIQVIQSATSVFITNANNTVVDKVQVNVGQNLVLRAKLSLGSTDSVAWKMMSADIKNGESADDSYTATNAGLGTTMQFHKAGTYVFRATAESGKYAEITIVVVVPTAALDFEEKVNDSYVKTDLLVLCQNQSATIRLNNILPAETSDSIYKWEDAAGLLSIKVAQDTKSAEVMAIMSGTTKLKITSESGATFSLNIKILIPATAISIEGKETPDDIVINRGGTPSAVTVTLAPYTTDDIMTWSVDKVGIITVAATGTATGATRTLMLTGIKAGEAILTVQTKGGAKNSVRIIVKALDIGDCNATVQAQTFNGQPLTPIPTKVTLSGRTLNVGTDYNITGYKNNTNVGTATMTLVGIGNYSGTAKVSFAINPKKLDSTVTVEYQEEHVYSQKDIRPKLLVKIGKTKLMEGVDYTVSYPESSSKLGTYRFTVTFDGNVKGTISKNYKVVAKSAKTFTIKNKNGKVITSLPDKTYTGEKIVQTFFVYDGKKQLMEGEDYTIEYADNLNAGRASVMIKGRGNYDINTTKVIKFKIKPYSLKKANISKIEDMNYVGWELEPGIVVRRQVGKEWKYLAKGNDYKVTYTNNVNTGKATVTISAGDNANYTDSKSVNFKIIPTQVLGVVQTSASAKSVKLSWEKTAGEVSGYSIYKFENDKYTYITSTKKESIVISGLKAGSNYTYAVRAYKKISQYTKYFSPTYSAFVTAMTVSNTPSIRLSSSDQTIKVNWNTAKGVTRYYVYYSVKGVKGPYKKAGYSAGTSYTINGGFKKGKTVYVKLQAARLIAGKEYFGSYSAAKKIKVR